MQIDTEGHCSPSLITFYSSLVDDGSYDQFHHRMRMRSAAQQPHSGVLKGLYKPWGYPASRQGLPAETGVYIAVCLRVGDILSFGTGRDGY